MTFDRVDRGRSDEPGDGAVADVGLRLGGPRVARARVYGRPGSGVRWLRHLYVLACGAAEGHLSRPEASHMPSRERKGGEKVLILRSRTRLFLCFIVVGVILVSGCGQQQGQQPTEQPPEAEQPSGTLKGVSLSPRSFQPDDFTDFFDKAKQTGEIVMWAGDWMELSDTSGSGPTVVAELASTYNYIPLIEAQFFTQSSGQLVRPLDHTTKQIYINNAADFAEKYKPMYLGFGIEVNVLYEKSPEDFDEFVRFYSEVYDAVKAKSPNTKVFTVFQLERMKGLHGGLFGGTNDPTNAQWSLLNRFKSDIIAFTTYPGLIYKDPSEIPVDYYAEIKSHAAKAIAFTEIGWHSDASPAGWESSDAEQADFVATFFSLTRDLNKELVIWSFMYDPDIFEPFKSMGLRRRSDGTAKPAWDEWINSK